MFFKISKSHISELIYFQDFHFCRNTGYFYDFYLLLVITAQRWRKTTIPFSVSYKIQWRQECIDPILFGLSISFLPLQWFIRLLSRFVHVRTSSLPGASLSLINSAHFFFCFSRSNFLRFSASFGISSWIFDWIYFWASFSFRLLLWWKNR